jgi:hypothetical protein
MSKSAYDGITYSGYDGTRNGPFYLGNADEVVISCYGAGSGGETRAGATAGYHAAAAAAECAADMY